MSTPREIIANALRTLESEEPRWAGADVVLAALGDAGYEVRPMRWIDTDEAAELFASVAEDDEPRLASPTPGSPEPELSP